MSPAIVMHPEDALDTPDRPCPPAVAWLRRITRQTAPLAAVPLPKKIGLRASISEFLLVSKLRARNMLGARGRAASIAADQATVLARFAHILDVTCKHWFPKEPSSGGRHQRQL